jgi:membrane-associated phospholipid phosphatase
MGVMPLATLTDMVLLRKEYPLLKRLLLDGSWLLTNELATRTAKVAAGRERPYVDPCQRNDDYVGNCHDGRDQNASFFSGHASTTATMAGLICTRHLNGSVRDIYDWLVCGGAAAASAATGLLRITAEQHNATDVIGGWASGAILGYVLPTYFEAKRGLTREAPRFSASLQPTNSYQRFGLRVDYSF